MGYEWTGMAYQEKRVGGEAILVFAMAVLLVYLVLAAQYESWFTPLAVILVVPLGLLGAVARRPLRGMDNNLYTQIGIVLIIALASKNAILIVEFARDLRNRGKSIREAAVEAARLRFRPILMTSFAFILGVVPLVIADGRRRRRPAGAGHRRVRRHDRLDDPGRVLRAGVLRGVPVDGRMVAGGSGNFNRAGKCPCIAASMRCHARKLDTYGTNVPARPESRVDGLMGLSMRPSFAGYTSKLRPIPAAPR